MADVLTPIETRLDAIIKGGRGVDGSLGTDAQARAITANIYRRSAGGASLRDVAYPLNQFDRVYALEWGAQALEEGAENEVDDRELVRIELRLLLGHIYGAAHAALLRLIGSEVAATAALRPRVRSNGDVVRLRRALCFYALHGDDTSPAIVSIAQAGPTLVEDLGDRILTTLPLSVLLEVSRTASYTP